MRKVNKAKWAKLQAEREAAKADHGQGGGLVKLNERVDRIEVLASIVPPAK